MSKKKDHDVQFEASLTTIKVRVARNSRGELYSRYPRPLIRSKHPLDIYEHLYDGALVILSFYTVSVLRVSSCAIVHTSSKVSGYRYIRSQVKHWLVDWW